MNIQFQKKPSGFKVLYAIATIIGALFLGFLALLFYLDARDLFTPGIKLAANSPLIILARVDTNTAPRRLVISEIWRQPKGASLLVGTKLPFAWPTNSSAVPDGIVLCYRQSFPVIEKGRFQSQEEFVIWQGRIDNMTIKEFKAACGL